MLVNYTYTLEKLKPVKIHEISSNVRHISSNEELVHQCIHGIVPKWMSLLWSTNLLIWCECQLLIIGACHEKPDLKVFVVVIPKEV